MNKSGKPRLVDRMLNWVEIVGNKLPDPALLFLLALLTTWVISWLMDGHEFALTTADGPKSQAVVSQLSGTALAKFLKDMVHTFTGFHPLGVVLVALLGVGVAERAGFINACLKGLLSFTPKALLTPMLVLVAIVSHTAADAGYVLVIPLGGVIFYAAGRHPLAGIATAFAGVSGGFSANFIPSGIDPLLSGLTQTGADIIDKGHTVNPLCNFWFTAASSVLIILVTWFLTDKVIEPRLKKTTVDGDPDDMPALDPMTKGERKGMTAGLLAMMLGLVALLVISLPDDSPMRPATTLVIEMKDGTVYTGRELEEPEEIRVLAGLKDWKPAPTGEEEGGKKPEALPEEALLVIPPSADPANTDGPTLKRIKSETVLVRPGFTGTEKREDILLYHDAREKRPAAINRALIERTTPQAGELSDVRSPLMGSIVPLIFLLFLIPGVVHGYVSGTFKTHRDVIKGMSKSMETMAYYLVMAFFAALFIYAFKESKLGALLAVAGADFLRNAGFPPAMTIIGIILLCASVNLMIGSASAKWAMLAPIFVPMLMQLGYSPEFTQAAYRVGDSSTNIITPLMPYFPLVVAFSQRYVKKTGIGTVTSLMLPYSISFIVLWTAFLLLWWTFGIELGVGGGYTYALPG
jgi:p-aminobenzoyl-glutamate transporter AbgT